MSKKSKVLVSVIRDGRIESTVSYDFPSLAEANEFVDNEVLESDAACVGCIKCGKSIKRVF